MTWAQFSAEFQRMTRRAPSSNDIIALKKALGLAGNDAHIGNQFLAALGQVFRNQQAFTTLIGQVAGTKQNAPGAGTPSGDISGPPIGPGGSPSVDNPNDPPGEGPPGGTGTPDPFDPVQHTPDPNDVEGGGPEDDRPAQPTSVRDGYEWVWDEEVGAWVMQPVEEEEPTGANDLFAYWTEMLGEFGLSGMEDLLERAIKDDWGTSQFLMEMRKHPKYLENPLFRANLERAAAGGGFLSEQQVIAWAGSARQIGKSMGYDDIPDSYLAMALAGSDDAAKSLAEIEHRLAVNRKMEEFGPAVQQFAEERLGMNLSDEDLFEIFDPETDTYEFDQAFKDAQYQARPFSLGLGIRSDAERRALEMLGVDPDEAFRRYEAIGANAPQFQKLGAIESMISEGLPGDFGSHLATAENSTLVKALLFPGTPEGTKALAELQAMTSREIARFKVGGGAAQNNQGQLVGLLSRDQR